MKTLSIAVPVYNTAPWLPRCLRSVLVDEALDELELICVNDGSRDESAELLARFQSQYPDTLILIDKENGGHGSAVNAALEAATGRYFRVLDSDDWFDTPAFLSYLRQLCACTEDLIVTPYTQELMETGAEIAYDYNYLEPGRVYTARNIPSGPDRQYFTMAASSWKTSLLKSCGLHLLERSCYVDMQYNAWPIPALRSLRLVPESVYRYCLGRTGQSMSPDALRKNAAQHQRVFCLLAEYCAASRSRMTLAQCAYLEQMLAFMYYSHIHLLQTLPRQRKQIQELERWLAALSPELFERVTFPALRVSRSLSYFDLALPASLRSLGSRVLRFAR